MTDADAPRDCTSPSIMLSRRRTILTLAAATLPLAAPQAFAVPAADLAFRVHRSGSPIGWLRTTFAQAGDQLTVRTRLELSVYLAVVRVFRYLHTSEEVWQGNKLLSLSSDTDSDGQAFRVRSTPVPGALRVDGSRGAVTIPDTTLTTNCSWNPLFVRQPMLIDCERGRHVPMTVQPLGDKSLQVMAAPRAATGYRTALPYADGDIWYAAGEWVHGVFRTRGEILTYERQS